MESKKVDLDSSFHAVDFGLKKKGLKSLPVEVVFWIPIVSEIPDSLSCISSKHFPDCGKIRFTSHEEKF